MTLSDNSSYNVIPVEPRYYTIVSSCDFQKIKERRWGLHRGYAFSAGEPLHSYILGRKEGHKIIHLNGDLLDNRRENLKFIESFPDIHGLKNIQKIMEIYSMQPGVNYPATIHLTVAEKRVADELKIPLHCHPSRPKKYTIIRDDGKKFDSASLAAASVYSNYAAQILRAVARKRKYSEYRWFLDFDNLTQDDIATFCANHLINIDDLESYEDFKKNN